MDKYVKFRGAVTLLYPGVKTVEVAGFPLGARGKWHQGNFRVLELMGMRKTRVTKAAILSKRALLQAIDTCKMFKILAR